MPTEPPHPPGSAGTDPSGLSRRTFIAASAVTGAAAVTGPARVDAAPAIAAETLDSRVSLTVNGVRHTVRVDNRTSLLDLVREHLGLPGTKKGCDAGACGAGAQPAGVPDRHATRRPGVGRPALDQPWVEEGNSCGGARKPMDWSKVGVVPGQPAVFTLTAVGELGYVESSPPSVLPLPASGTFALGVGEAVPPSEYPFPPRPQTLRTFVPHHPEPTIELRADLSDLALRKDLTVEWPGRNVLLAQMNTPGRMRVLVNDVVVIDFSHWSYDVGSMQIEPTNWMRDYGLQVSEGETVKITVIPERITGDWMVTLAPRRR